MQGETEGCLLAAQKWRGRRFADLSIQKWLMQLA
jgi:hypothetical protein